ncbi:uncharacterized protein BDZ99DRAFT_145725 [Mytilinidion resinicola]|uniref:Uncharacterized protein n=1 Tax=Mytilinidion resinicola TaxID=574789 RepID=A0A6A6Y7W1_9PEZI|nr:uncharacterized protein BDZ99DRAFT_145725 [Mytilinidion resinicola]KAF2804916.1 hypothetical protein BDZ99DRAFT_145725 [Mytilinidion resinicola]
MWVLRDEAAHQHTLQTPANLHRTTSHHDTSTILNQTPILFAQTPTHCFPWGGKKKNSNRAVASTHLLTSPHHLFKPPPRDPACLPHNTLAPSDYHPPNSIRDDFAQWPDAYASIGTNLEWQNWDCSLSPRVLHLHLPTHLPLCHTAWELYRSRRGPRTEAAN